ncbi:oxidoreductase [Cytidiella melzeri]|nr:oxidoreductase [Cytidiella melzeri]
MTAPSPIRTCVLGVGLAGLTFHIPFVLALPHLFTLYAVLERNPDGPGGKLQARFGPGLAKGVKIYNSLDQVLADPAIELVIVGTPSETHYDFAKRVLEAGKHALVDKPVTATFAQAAELDALAKSKRLVLYPYQNRRWDSDFLALRSLLELPSSDPKSIGTLFEFESRFDRYRATLKGTWKDLPLPANGLTYDLAAHTIDQVLLLFGRPTSITAHIQNIRGIGHIDVDDHFTILLHYPPSEHATTSHSQIRPTSFTAILRGTILSAKSSQVRYVIRGTTGTYSKYGVDVQEDQLKAIASPSDIFSNPLYGQEPEELFGTLETLDGDDVVQSIWPSSAKGDYSGLFKDVASAIRSGTPQAVKWEESAHVIEIIELAYQSSKERRTLEVPPRS